MKKNIFVIAALILSSAAYSQVGINTETPKTTMDVSAKRTAGGAIDGNNQLVGLQAPRMTRTELTANTAIYATDQKGALIYITDISGGTASGQRVNMDAVGYYYFDGSLWQKFSGGTGNNDTNIYNTDGTLTGNRIVTEASNTLTFTGTAIGANKFINSNGAALSPQSPIQIIDGGQAAGKILTSDANGNATWKDIQMFSGSPVNGTFTWAANTNIGNGGWNSVAYLDVPPGTHFIYAKIHFLANDINIGAGLNYFIRFFIGKDNLGTNTLIGNFNPILGTNNFQPLVRGNTQTRDFEMNTNFMYTNSSNVTERLYMNVQSDVNGLQRSVYVYPSNVNFRGVNLTENYFYYVKAN